MDVYDKLMEHFQHEYENVKKHEITAELVGPIWDGDTKYEKVLLSEWVDDMWEGQKAYHILFPTNERALRKALIEKHKEEIFKLPEHSKINFNIVMEVK